MDQSKGFSACLTPEQGGEIMAFGNEQIARLMDKFVLGAPFASLCPSAFGAALGQIEGECKNYVARHPYLLAINAQAHIITANNYSAFVANAANVVNETVGLKTGMIVADVSTHSIDDVMRLSRENDQLKSLLRSMGAKIA